MEHGDVSETMRLQQLYARRMNAGQAGARADCAPPEAILALVRREGSEEQRLATLEHVMSCAMCHREYEWLKAVNESGHEAAGGAHALAQRRWWRGSPLAVAASVLMAVGVGVVLSGVLRPGVDLERGAGRDITLVSAGTPPGGDGPVTFAWRTLPAASGYVLEVQRQDGTVVVADTTSDTVAVVERSRLASDAVYRWWVREVTDGGEPASSVFRELRLPGSH